MLDIIPMTVIEEVHDKHLMDGILFDVNALFIHVIDMFGLAEKAMTGTIEIAFIIDGAKFEGKLYHVTIGFKVVDVSAIDTNTGEKVYKSMEPDPWYIPIVTLIEKDNKSTCAKKLEKSWTFTIECVPKD
jgi:hypothetical protein